MQQGGTPLDIAMIKVNDEAAGALVRAGADLDIGVEVS